MDSCSNVFRFPIQTCGILLSRLVIAVYINIEYISERQINLSSALPEVQREYSLRRSVAN